MTSTNLKRVERACTDLLRDGIGDWFDLLGGWHDAFRAPAAG